MRHPARILGAILMALLVAACGGGSGTVDDDPFASPIRQPAGGGGGGGGGQGSGTQPIGGGGGGGTGGGGGGANTGGAPDWVRVGTRLTWYSSAASIAQSRFQWVEDPTGPWEDPKTGKRYRRTDEGIASQPPEGQPKVSGDGVSQIDVLAIEGSDVVLSSNLYTVNRAGAQPTLDWTIGPGAKVSGVAVDGAWVHPGLLAQFEDPRLQGLLILRGPYTVGGTTYQATSFTNTSSGVYLSYVYDSRTGILLSATTSTGGATSPFSAPGQNAPTGNTQLTHSQFLGMRQRTMPGLGARSPGWVAGTQTLRYGGVYNVTNPVNPAAGSFNYEVQYTVTLGQGGLTWSPYQARSVVQTLGEQAPVNNVTGSTGLYWYDPAALATMTPGQVLDEDPLIGQRTVVSAAGSGAGGNIVAIDVSMPGTFSRASYDRSSGTLVAYELQQVAPGTTIRLQLQGG